MSASCCSLAFAIPGDIETPTGGYGYDRRLIAELRKLGWEVAHVPLPGSYPFPDEAARAATRERLAQVPAGVPLLVDGLAFAVMAEEAAVLAGRRPLVALVHHPLAHETGLDPAIAAKLRASEGEALGFARAVIVTSPATAQALASEFRVAPEKITVAVPGTDPVPPARGSGGPGVRMLSVGSLLPRKGHLDLVTALASLTALDWSLDIVGGGGLDPPYARMLVRAVEEAGLTERISLRGALKRDALDALYDGADLFVLASHYEGYGMAYMEAVAHGLPVVGTTGGAIAETVGSAAELVAPGDVPALRDVLARLLAEPAARERLAVRAREAASALPCWPDTARRVAGAIAGLAAGARG
ncbi:glycosyltransferase family 4 protein [Ancylobacter sp. 6x-1]|uniref:Glycosyltransferase family 4 protein n=1 Tax=Ancylobacter crimeensis TaxID=2579147 RepID=A0ABT0DFB6_9HYPH|nr:glycosyltransferase family 4 protein [Ancylobacter crimeensis]MCK0198651.1 glycosyltransferase family 4 protein [Ancylobacter crimeensis]